MAVRADDIDLARDRALVEAWQAGDASAFDDLYRLYFDRLRAFCERRVGNRTDAEEIAQESFAKALQALPRLSGDRRFYPWMTVIASRLCIDLYRRRARVEPSDEIDPGTVDDGHDERLALQVDLTNLDRALGRLGPRHTEVLDLRERQGMSYHEIAGALGVPHSTVETLLFRARRALRREFHLVSADRLAGVPVVGWAIGRVARLRDRIAASGVDLSSLGAPLAAGAVSVLLAIPGGPTPPTAVAAGAGAGPGPRPAPVTTPASPPPTVALPHTTSSAEPSQPTVVTKPAVTPMSDGEAAQHASTMPLHLDTGELGAGLDPQPIIDQLTTSVTGRTHP